MLKSVHKESPKLPGRYPKLMKSKSGNIYLMRSERQGVLISLSISSAGDYLGEWYSNLLVDTMEDFIGTVTLTGE